MGNVTKNVHFALRIPLTSRVGGRSLDTVESHNEVIRRSGQVALGKFGSAGSHARQKAISEQIGEGVVTQLILVGKSDGRFIGVCAPLSAIMFGPLSAEFSVYAPDYYSRLPTRPSLWFVVRQTFQPCSLRSLQMASSQRPLLAVMKECRTSSMLVTKSSESENALQQH